MITSPTVTVGLPVCNGENFLDDAIRSIRDQTFGDFELLIADNASDDATPDICARHAAEDSRITVFRSETNRGAAWNFNRIVDRARGRYFKWAAHDDLIGETYLELCMAPLENDDGIALVFPSAVDIDEQGGRLDPVLSVDYGEHDDVEQRAAAFCAFETPCVEVFGLMRADVLRETGLIGHFTSSDRVLLLELALRGRFAHVDEVLMYRRQHGTRSIANDARARNAWFDPQRRSIAFPRWRLVGELVRAVLTSPHPALARLRMTGSVARYGWRHRRRLAREALAGPVLAARSAMHWLTHRDEQRTGRSTSGVTAR